MRLFSLLLLCVCLPVSALSQAVTIHGIVHDPDHRPIAHATVLLESATGARAAQSNDNGEFNFAKVTPAAYQLIGTAKGFGKRQLSIQVEASDNPVFHLELPLQSQSQQITVAAKTEQLSSETSTSQTTVTAQQILRAPGADRANSLAMITDFVPGA
ncbi:MAG: carboxypeptidase-like regulatory domain-containing protein, partial [Terriglobales bacterium]